MNWERLKSMKCPKCQGELVQKLTTLIYICNKNCSFCISTQRFDEIINGLYKNKPAMAFAHDNAEALNNLGHYGISEDFSDSPHLNR